MKSLIKKKAEKFLKNNYFWNSGIFLLNNEKLVSDFEKYHPKDITNFI